MKVKDRRLSEIHGKRRLTFSGNLLFLSTGYVGVVQEGCGEKM
jgi:hypothetical protein